MEFAHEGYTFRHGDRYKIHQVLGRGGFGTVYKISNSAGRFYACKILDHEVLSNPEKVETFQRETRIGINMLHEHLVSFHKSVLIHGDRFGQEDLIYPAIIMDFVEGVSFGTFKKLYQRRFQKALPRDYAILILAKACSGIQVLHQAGIRHGDIKPANILISKSGFPKVTDYGIAATVGEDVDHRGITGTVRYLAPEQLRATLEKGTVVDHLADIYSLGVVALEMTAGLPKVLYGESGPVLRYVFEHNRELLDYVTRTDLPTDLKFVIKACLTEDRERRPENVRNLQNVLLQTIYGKFKGITLEDIGDCMGSII